MGMSTHIFGFKPPDAKWKKMKKIWDACQEAGVDVPKEVDDYFNGEYPDDAGVEVDLEKSGCVKEVHEDSYQGYELDVKKLPKDVTIIRFVNSF